ncbi:uncharacterized protein [Typha angustifolia]|uniref:uncharacterized protein n=1 Tax=Typha angustifolia TaxID=59011 RepID=UPI003C3041E0
MATVEVQLATNAASLPENSPKEQPNDAQEASKDEIEVLPTSTPTPKMVQEEESIDVVEDPTMAQEFESKVEIKASEKVVEPEEANIEKPIEKIKAVAAVVPVDEPEEVEVPEEAPVTPEETKEELEEKHQVEEAGKGAPSEEKSDE